MQKVDTKLYLSTDSLSIQSHALTEIRIKNPKQLIITHLNIDLLMKSLLMKSLINEKLWYRIK